MRDIKFRAIWGNEVIYGSLINRGILRFIEPFNESHRQILVNPNTIGQFTGLQDANGQDIYEGDIVIHNGERKSVVFKDQCFVFTCKRDSGGHLREVSFFMNNECKVIGNIHQNPELL